MFDRIFDAVETFLHWFQFAVVIDEYERGVVLTWGRYRGRVLRPGLAFIWPFGVDEVIVDNVVRAPLSLEAQSLITADDVPIILSAMATWQICDIEQVTLRNEGAEDVLEEIIYGAIARYVRRTNCDIIRTDKFVRRLRDVVRRKAKPLGVEIIDFEIVEFIQKAKNLRLIND